jgi:hypothetical protein
VSSSLLSLSPGNCKGHPGKLALEIPKCGELLRWVCGTASFRRRLTLLRVPLRRSSETVVRGAVNANEQRCTSQENWGTCWFLPKQLYPASKKSQ